MLPILYPLLYPPEYSSRRDFLEDYRRRTTWVRALYDRIVPK